MNASPSITCRLCGGRARHRFTLQVMKRYDVGYYLCHECDSLQTEEPYWLKEAYQDQRRYYDTFTAMRALYMSVRLSVLMRIFRLDRRHKILDWGGGDGLGVRMMRDVGLDAYRADRYAENVYALGFDATPDTNYSVVTASEVFEHFADPATDLGDLFAGKPQLLLASTARYSGQGEEWGYLFPLVGRHVFFYSEKAIRWIGNHYGYSVYSTPEYHVFSKQPIRPWQRGLMRFMFSPRYFRFMLSAHSLSSSLKYAVADRQRMMEEYK